MEGSLVFEVAEGATPLEARLAGLEGLVAFAVGPAPTAPELVEKAEALVQRVVDGDDRPDHRHRMARLAGLRPVGPGRLMSRRATRMG